MMITVNIIALIAIAISWIVVYAKGGSPLGEYETYLQMEAENANGFVITKMGKVDYVSGDAKTRDEALSKLTNNTKQIILWIDTVFCLFCITPYLTQL